MIKIATTAEASKIHGIGLFSCFDIPKGTVVWAFEPSIDSKVLFSKASDTMRHYGYINPLNPEYLVICGDDSRWMNFSENANCESGQIDQYGEFVLVASRDVATGEELTVSQSSDLDYNRKMMLS